MKKPSRPEGLPGRARRGFTTAKQIKFGYKLVDTLYPLSNGDMLVDLTKFDLIEPDGVSVPP